MIKLLNQNQRKIASTITSGRIIFTTDYNSGSAEAKVLFPLGESKVYLCLETKKVTRFLVFGFFFLLDHINIKIYKCHIEINVYLVAIIAIASNNIQETFVILANMRQSLSHGCENKCTINKLLLIQGYIRYRLKFLY